MKARDYLGIAEKIRTNEVSLKEKIEVLRNDIMRFSQQIDTLRSEKNLIRAEMAAERANKDENGNYDVGRVNALYAQLSAINNQIGAISGELERTRGQLEKQETEMERVQEEKERTLFAIKESAYAKVQNINVARTLNGAYSGVGQKIAAEQQAVHSTLSQAAGILGSSVDSVNSGGGISGTGSSVKGGASTGTQQMSKNTSPISAFSGSTKSNDWMNNDNYSTMQQASASFVETDARNYDKKRGRNTNNFISFQGNNVDAIEAFSSYSAMNETVGVNNFVTTQEANGMDNSFGNVAPNNEGSFLSGMVLGTMVAEKSERNNQNQDNLNHFQKLMSYMSEHGYTKEDFAIYSKDPEWQRLHEQAYPNYKNPKEQAFYNLKAYMDAHNYGAADYPVYSKDPEWQRLHEQVYPNNKMSKEQAFYNLSAYMNAHNYGYADYPEYSKDPEWMRLHKMAYPEFHEQNIYLHNNSKAIGDIYEKSFKQSSGRKNNNDRVSRYNLLKNIPVNELTRKNLDELVDLNIETILEISGDFVDRNKITSLKDRIKFETREEILMEVGPDYANTYGFYDPVTDEIVVNLSTNESVADMLGTIIHESYHASSKFPEIGKRGAYNNDLRFLNVGLDEGITELLTRKAMDSFQLGYKADVYIHEIQFVKLLQKTCGEDLDKTLYYDKNGWEKIEKSYNQVSNVKNGFKRLCNRIDYLHYLEHETDAYQTVQGRARIAKNLSKIRHELQSSLKNSEQIKSTKSIVISNESHTSNKNSGESETTIKARKSFKDFTGLRNKSSEKKTETSKKTTEQHVNKTTDEKRAEFIKWLQDTAKQGTSDPVREHVRRNTSNNGNPEPPERERDYVKEYRKLIADAKVREDREER